MINIEAFGFFLGFLFGFTRPSMHVCCVVADL